MTLPELADKHDANANYRYMWNFIYTHDCLNENIVSWPGYVRENVLTSWALPMSFFNIHKGFSMIAQNVWHKEKIVWMSLDWHHTDFTSWV